MDAGWAKTADVPFSVDVLNEQTARKIPTSENHPSGVPFWGCVDRKLSGVFKLTEGLFTMFWVERNQLQPIDGEARFPASLVIFLTLACTLRGQCGV